MRKRGSFRSAKKLGWRRSFPPGVAPLPSRPPSEGSRAGSGVRRPCLRKAAESTAHVAGFGMYFGELRLSKPLTGGAGRMAPGCLRGRVWRDAFLVSFGHSKRLRARGAVRPALEREARERLPRRKGERGYGPASLLERQAAFLAPQGRSKRLRGGCARCARRSLGSRLRRGTDPASAF